MIPKVIHYCWFGGKPLSLIAKKCIASWRKYCPDYEIKRWDETNFDVTSHPFMKAAYEAGLWAFVSDLARLMIIYEHGGIYLDTDVELLKPLDFLLENPCYIGVQQVGPRCTTGLGFGAAKANPVVQKMLSQYDGVEFSVENMRNITCTGFCMRAVESVGYRLTDSVVTLPDITVYPPAYFDPIEAGDYPNLLCADSVSIHLGGMSWMDGKQRLKRDIICLVGVERVYRLKQAMRRLRRGTHGKEKKDRT